MNRRTVSLAMALLFLATLLVVPASAQTGSVVEINLLFYDPVTTPVTPLDTVVIHSGAGACSPGLVQRYINASNYEVSLDGATILFPEDVDELWAPIGPPPLPYWFCKHPETSSAASWFKELGQLPAGEHAFRTVAWTERPIHDGVDWDGEHGPDRAVVDIDKTITVLVK